MSQPTTKTIPTANPLVELESNVLNLWDELDAFNESVRLRPTDKRYVFYDGPPFATGLPHYGHLLASTIKDIVPRYWTMRGYRVDRVWGWDCHGIPIENMIEKELDLKGGKKGIEEFGIGAFNAACRAAILRFDEQWEQTIRRIGRWVDFKHSYKTMDKQFMESVWWAFKTLHDKQLVYEGRRVILYCPRCATPLSNFEIAMDNSYKDVEDNSLYVKFPVTGDDQTYLLAWTTTPWTLIGNVALAVDASAQYVKIRVGDEQYYLAQERLEYLFPEKNYEVIETITGQALVDTNIEYQPLYTYMPLDGKRAYYVTTADFVSLQDGTGIVHTAAIYGEDDYRLAVERDLPCVATMDDQGKFLDFVEPLAGVFFKKAEQWVIDDLTARNLTWKAEKILHSYPFCYRCETPLYYNAVPAWFIDIQTLKPSLIAQNEQINWHPGHLKAGRFGKGLETAPDWNISRSRYWGTPMPVWVGASGTRRIIGSIAELQQWAVHPEQVQELTDIHREYIDDVEVWVDDAKTEVGRRIPEVFDCWIESGSMPYAAIHYPFEHQDLFTQTHPAQFISEYIAQTRAWFYTLHVMSVGLFGTNTFENAVTTGTVLAEDGSKMSKSKKNYPDPAGVLERYGADSLRLYLTGSSVMDAEGLNFSETDLAETYKKYSNTLWNVFTFYQLFADKTHNPVVSDTSSTSEHVLDQWVLATLQDCLQTVTQAFDQYRMRQTALPLVDFVQELSTWYVRRCRTRLKGDDAADAAAALKTLHQVLLTFVKIAAPVTPFIAEHMYQALRSSTDPVSVHHCDWPSIDSPIDRTSLSTMARVREIIQHVLALRAAAGLKVRQPLGSVTITGDKLAGSYEQILCDELNVKAVQYGSQLALDTTLTDELRREGTVREFVRQVNALRKKLKLSLNDILPLQCWITDQALKNTISTYSNDISKQVLAREIIFVDQPQPQVVKVDGIEVSLDFVR